jgi:hypothetical protein
VETSLVSDSQGDTVNVKIQVDKLLSQILQSDLPETTGVVFYGFNPTKEPRYVKLMKYIVDQKETLHISTVKLCKITEASMSRVSMQSEECVLQACKTHGLQIAFDWRIEQVLNDLLHLSFISDQQDFHFKTAVGM